MAGPTQSEHSKYWVSVWPPHFPSAILSLLTMVNSPPTCRNAVLLVARRQSTILLSLLQVPILKQWAGLGAALV